MGWQVMHLLKIDESGALYDSDEAVDLGQPAGDVVILTSADTEVSLLARAAADSDIWKDQIRIANYLSLTHQQDRACRRRESAVLPALQHHLVNDPTLPFGAPAKRTQHRLPLDR
ncbi:hypothetical protein N9T26_00265 [Alphaproteobacteria bacterium]|nr:hypothetical protein [Alphaproteobacteria bacterium]